jgi:hypothetical protein
LRTRHDASGIAAGAVLFILAAYGNFCGIAPVAARYSRAMRHLTLVLLIAAALSSCGDIVIGPVDHSCPTNPAKGHLGSGCGGGGGR